MNSVNLIGRLTQDPESRGTNGGGEVTTLRLAVPRAKARDGAERPPVYVDVSAFGPLGEVCARYLTKGRQVGVAGRLEHQEWQAPDGARRQRHLVVAESVDFLGPRPGESTPAEAEAA